MKTIQTTFKYFIALALVVTAVGCASNNLLDEENVAMAAGFKIITPTKPEQEALLRKLPPDKVTPITHNGKTYFVLPDQVNDQAYVGGPKQYQAYKQLRQKQEMDSEDYVASPDPVEVVEINTMNWGEWGGWGPGDLDDPGWY